MAIDINGIFNTISPIADKVFSSYANKGQVDNGTWLTGILASHEATADNANSMSRTIQSTVNRFSANMQDIDATCAAEPDKTKTRWLKDFISSNPDLNQEEKRHYLAQVDAALRRGNEVMVNFIIAPTPTDMTHDDLSSAQWNRYSTINDIAQQSVLMGANGVQILIDQNAMQSEEILQEDITEPLNPEIDKGIKMAMSAALAIGHALGKIPSLAKDTPLSAIVNIACVGVEVAKNIGQAAMKKIPVSKAMENIGRASIVAVADFCTTGIPAMALIEIPVVGPTLSKMCAGFLVSRSSKDIQQKIYAGIDKIKPALKKLTDTIKNAANTVTNTIKNTVNAVINTR